MTSPSDCAVCGGVRWVRPEMPNANGRLVPCPACRKSGMSVDELRRRCNLTASEQALRFADIGATPKRQEALRAAQATLEKNGWLTLYSKGKGTGKSTLGTAIVNEALAANRSAALWLMPALLEEIKKSWSAESKLHADLPALDYAIQCDVLVIDEFEAVQFTDWSESILNLLFLQRYRRAKETVTVWITNVTPTLGLGEKLGKPKLDSMFSRMLEFLMIEMNDPDVRPALGKRRAKELLGHD